MDKVCYSDNDYKIIHNNRDYVLINLNGEYKNHGHLKKFDTCLMLIRLMKRKVVPKSKYLQESVLRLTTDESYINKIKNKQEKNKNKPHYININKGI